jgi:hypothetical protein
VAEPSLRVGQNRPVPAGDASSHEEIGAEGRLARHHERADGLLVELKLLVQEAPVVANACGRDPQVRRWLERLTREDAASLAVVAAHELAANDNGFGASAGCVAYMAENQPALGVEDARLMLSFDALKNQGHYTRQGVMRLVLSTVEALVASRTEGARELANEVADHVEAWNPEPFFNVAHRYVPEVWALRERALALAGRRAGHNAVEVGPILMMDAFGIAAVEHLGSSVDDWPVGVWALLRHCAMAKAARPSAKWGRTCRSLLDDSDSTERSVHELLDLVVDTEPVAFMTDHGQHRRLLTSGNDDLVRGLVWAAGVVDPDWLVPELEAVAGRCMRGSQGRTVRTTPVSGEKVPYACFQVLAQTGSPDAVGALGRLLSSTSNRTTRKRLLAELEGLASRLEVSVDDLLETSQPDWGLDASGSVRIDLGSIEAVLRLDNGTGVSVSWLVDGKEAKRRPAGLSADAFAEVKERQAELRKAVAVERGRLEAYLVSGREWPLDEFHERLMVYPLSGWFARRLFWEVRPLRGEPVIGLPTDRPDRFDTKSGSVEVDGEAMVAMWHPIRSDADEVRALRELAASLGLVQPFRQVWRETYRPDEVELGTGLYSSRFAAHIVRFHQFYGLARERGWWGGFLSGSWDGGQAAVAQRDFGAAGIQAQWTIGMFDQGDTRHVVDLAVTDRLSFVPLGEKDPAPIPIAEVPAVVFSEAMRDLDLFASVSTVANDPFWLEKLYAGSRPVQEYWEAMASGGFAEAVSHRREALGALLGDLPDADRFELGQRELVVRGTFRTYHVDLATANVRMDPPGRWLAFDAKIGARAPTSGILPIVDDDVILGRVLARAALLARDDKITNPSLREQLRDR